MPEIDLAEVIRELRSELQEAMTAGRGENLQFEASALEVEFQVGITRSTEGTAGVKFWVFEAGGSTNHARESVHKVTLSLSPIAEGDRPVRIASETSETPLRGPEKAE